MNESDDLYLNFNQGEISFPVSQQNFRDFISSILSRPNVLEGIKRGSFVVNKEFIIHLDQALTHRVNSQNNLWSSDSSIKVHYEDETSEEFNSLVQFEYEQCKRHVLCIGFTCVWKFVIQFEQNTPQIQTVILSATSEINKENTYEGIEIEYHPVFRYSIQFTDRIWAREIERIIAQEFIPQAQRKRRRIEKIMFRARQLSIPEWVNSLMGFSVFFMVIYFGFQLFSNGGNPLRVSISEFSSTVERFESESVDSSEKLDFIIRLLKPITVSFKDTSSETTSLGDFLSFIIEFIKGSLVFTYIFTSAYVLSRRFSKCLPEDNLFILFNEKTVSRFNDFEDNIRANQDLFSWIFILFMASIPVGIFVNYMSDFLW